MGYKEQTLSFVAGGVRLMVESDILWTIKSKPLVLWRGGISISFCVLPTVTGDNVCRLANRDQ